MPQRPKIMTTLGMTPGQVQLGDFVGSIFKKTNNLLEQQMYYDILDDMRFKIGRMYDDVIDFAVCEVFGVKYREAFAEYKRNGGPELCRCKWFTRADRERIDHELCCLIPECVSVCMTIEDYWAILCMLRVKVGTKWEYDGSPAPRQCAVVSDQQTGNRVFKEFINSSGKKRVYLK